MKNDQIYQVVINQATKLANEAGDNWVKTHTTPIWNVKDGNRIVGQLLDVCGIVFIKVTDRRTKFFKWCIENGYAYKGGSSIRIPHNYQMRQEQSLQEAADGAALSYLRKVGIDGLTLYSNID